jgi:hypothetical protein
MIIDIIDIEFSVQFAEEYKNLKLYLKIHLTDAEKH